MQELPAQREERAGQAARLGLAVGCGEGLDPLHRLGAVVECVHERALAHLVRLRVLVRVWVRVGLGLGLG